MSDSNDMEIALENITSDFKERDIKKNVTKKIGSGSYADVRKFTDPLLGEDFVFKKLKSNCSSNEIQRFKLEYEILKKFNSLNIVKVFIFYDRKNEYLMEFCDDTLFTYMKKNNGNLDDNQRLEIVNQFLNGIKLLHGQEYLHRDISRNNILIKQYQDEIKVKISDFGQVKDLNSNGLTSVETELKGSWLDPELRRYADYDIQNEIFSIGKAIGYIFTGRDSISINDAFLLKEVYDKCMNRDLDIRYKNIFELEEDINKICTPSTKQESYEVIVDKMESIKKIGFKVTDEEKEIYRLFTHQFLRGLSYIGNYNVKLDYGDLRNELEAIRQENIWEKEFAVKKIISAIFPNCNYNYFENILMDVRVFENFYSLLETSEEEKIKSFLESFLVKVIEHSKESLNN